VFGQGLSEAVELNVLNSHISTLEMIWLNKLKQKWLGRMPSVCSLIRVLTFEALAKAAFFPRLTRSNKKKNNEAGLACFFVGKWKKEQIIIGR